ncbi:exonuclease domain-containing protein [Flavobacterium sp.]|uniref:exonuclease domain-containing protein n=1 Tax=Flavobacterium sp. TaxID=239 RepID=UPI00375281A6
MYAILDIETTGGQFNEEGITEIAIYKFDGHEIVDQFISLVNPEIPIQPFVVKLTGINNEMLRLAPKFHEVAKRIIEITQDCIIVAHNAVFDYRILCTEFRRLGYEFNAKNLCTVALSQRLLPEQPSHSLGKLVRALGIPMADRHRASGDAMATVKLFKILLEKDLEKTIVREFVKYDIQKGIAPKFRDILDQLPSKTGVYYIHDNQNNIIYIGKSKNIKKRVNQHLIGTTSKCKKIQRQIFAVTYDETGSELIALLKESQEIKINKPLFNKSLQKTNFHIGLYKNINKEGYFTLDIQRIDGRKKEITLFSSITEAQNFLHLITSHYNLCQKFTNLSDSKNECFQHKIKECNGACIGKESTTIYNEKVTEFINENTIENATMLLVDRGRNVNERSAVFIENGLFKGYCFYDLNYQINNISILKNIIIKMENNRDSKNIIQSFIRKSKYLKIIKF